MVLKQIAQKISEDTTKIIGFPVSISDESGYLIGVNDLSRLGLFDNLLAEVIKTKKLTYYNEDAVTNYPNIFPGVASPIIVNDKVLGAVGIIGKTEKDIETLNYIRLVKNHIEMLCHEAITKEVNSLKSSTIDTLVHFILNFSREVDEEEKIIRHSQMLGFDLNISRVCLIVKFIKSNEAKPTRQMHNEILDLLTELFLEHHEDLLGRLTIDDFCILKHVKDNEEVLSENFINKLQANINKLNEILNDNYNVQAILSIGNIDFGINGIQNSYANALHTIEASKLLNLNANLINYNDLTTKLNIMINNLPDAFLNRVEPILEPLLLHQNYSLMSNTFIVYCESKFNLSEAARELYIHRNSLIYRLNQISKITNIDFNNFAHCILLYLFLVLNKPEET